MRKKQPPTVPPAEITAPLDEVEEAREPRAPRSFVPQDEPSSDRRWNGHPMPRRRDTSF